MTPLSRRRFTMSLGASLLVAPILSMLNGTTRADSSKFAKRVLFFGTFDGTFHNYWRPTGSGTNFSFPKGSILEPLSAYKSDIIVCDGIDFKGVENHDPGMGAMLTGGGDASSVSRGMSVDQYIASKIAQKGDTFPALTLGVVSDGGWGASRQTRMCYTSPGQFAPPNDSPKDVFKTMFGAVSEDPKAVDKTLKRSESIINLVNGELNDLRARVGGEERHKIDDHIEAVHERMESLYGKKDCKSPGKPFELDPQDYANYPAIGRAQMDLAVLALACGMTRVASIQWHHTVGDNLVFSWLKHGTAHHTLSHKRDDLQYVEAERWYTEQFVYLIDLLKKTPDPQGGTMLDSTLVVWCKEIGDGPDHKCQSVPFVLAGGRYFQTGRYLNFGGAPHQQLLVSICQAMGLSNDSFGDASKGKGPLKGL